MIGKTISHYKIIEKLGEGGMGEVYLAEDLKLERQVAIKFLPQRLTDNQENIERFEREARAAAALNHPNIVTIHDVIEKDDSTKADRQTFIVMEYVEGKTLRDILDTSSQFPIPNSFNIINQLCDGLACAHDSGIVHRDIKPANIIISDRGEVKILDFGLAKLTGQVQLTKESSTLGTVAYMSPEQLSGKEIDHRSDIWSVGIILYEMLTGEKPFKGDYEQAVIYAILNEELKPHEKSGTFENWQPIIQNALSKNPDARYQNILQLFSDIDTPDSDTRTEVLPNENGKKLLYKKLLILYTPLSFALAIIILIVFSIIPSTEKNKIDSIAVLPMENLSKNPEMEYLTIGMTEAMIAELAKIESLRVISRTSIMLYKNSDKSLPEIASELNVKAVLEGSAVIHDEQIRITVQLIEADQDQHIWIGQYDSDLKDIFALYSRVAKDIAQNTQINLTVEDEKRLAGARQVNPEAYRLYIEGMKFRHIEGENNYRKAAELFTKAIELDPDFALAQARLSLCYSILNGIYGRSEENFAVEAKAALNKALALNRNLSEAYVAQGLYHAMIYKDWRKAEKSYRQAIQLNPGSIEPHLELGLLLTRYGNDLDRAFAEFELAKNLDPRSVQAANAATGAYFQVRDYDKVIELCKRRLEVEPEQMIVRLQLGLAYTLKGNPEKGLAEFKKMPAGNDDYMALGGKGFAYSIMDRKEEAQKILNDIRKKWPKGKLLPSLIEARLGNWDDYLTDLEQKWAKYERRPFLNLGDPFFDPIRSDPRFIALAKSIRMK